MTLNLAVLISGSGTTLQNFINQISEGKLDAKIEVVISSRPFVLGIERARKARIPTEVIERKLFDSDAAYGAAITDVVDRAGADLVLCAGFLRRYLFPERYRGRVLNIHPGLLPKYGGKGMYGHHVHEAVIAAGESESGCTVIIADEEYDHGPVILERRVPVLPGDDADALAARVFEAECEAYPEALRMMAAQMNGAWSKGPA